MISKPWPLCQSRPRIGISIGQLGPRCWTGDRRKMRMRWSSVIYRRKKRDFTEYGVLLKMGIILYGVRVHTPYEALSAPVIVVKWLLCIAARGRDPSDRR